MCYHLWSTVVQKWVYTYNYIIYKSDLNKKKSFLYDVDDSTIMYIQWDTNLRFKGTYKKYLYLYKKLKICVGQVPKNWIPQIYKTNSGTFF